MNNPYDDNNWNPQQAPVRPKIPVSQALEGAALICGILSLFGILTIYLALLFGGTAIVLALLSRGNKRNIARKAMTGLVTGLISVVITIAMICIAFTFIFTNYGSVDRFLIEYAPVVEELTGTDINGDGTIGSESYDFGDDYQAISGDNTSLL